jgi:hypothetical protein
MRQQRIISLRALCFVSGLALTISASSALAGSDKPSADLSNPSFGSRIEQPDGSVAMTMGRRLPMEWDTKIGSDVHLARPVSPVPSENLLLGTTPDQSSGAVWGNVTMPGLRPLGWDKTSIEARVDTGKEEGKLGATLSRAVPVSKDLSVTLQNSYSVTRPLAEAGPQTPILPLTANASGTGPVPPAAGTSSIWATGQSVRLNINPSGTSLSAGVATSTADDEWHNKLSVEQTLFGPLKVTTSVEDAGSAASKKSITAGFKRAW